jgi:hypothetical protein
MDEAMADFLFKNCSSVIFGFWSGWCFLVLDLLYAVYCWLFSWLLDPYYVKN